MNDMPLHPYRLAILASGNGSNAGKIMEHFADSPNVAVSLILSNRADAFALKRAENAGISAMALSGKEMRDGNKLLKVLKQFQIDFIILAGYLLLIPVEVTHAFPGRIVNIHPALLPAYGGKGMYGEHVHQAVIAAGEKESGITIHYINEHFDEGTIIFQARCPVLPDDTPETLAQRVHLLEHQYYPAVIEDILPKR